jgi:hypothetical protein
MASVAVFGVGCGDDGGSGGNNGGGGGFSTSVDGSAELGGLSEGDETTLCDDGAQYAASQISEESACTFAGTFSAGFSNPSTDEEAQQACIAARDSCLEDDGSDDEDTCDAFPAECTATVSEYTACQEARLVQTKTAFDSLAACEELTLEDLESDEDGPNLSENPPECEPVEEKCPSLFGDDSPS